MTNFKKIFFILSLFLFTFAGNLKSEIVNKIEVQGNERISDETVAIFGDVILGKDYDKSDINSLIDIGDCLPNRTESKKV